MAVATAVAATVTGESAAAATPASRRDTGRYGEIWLLHHGEVARLPEEVGEAGAEGGLVAHRHEHASSGRTEERYLA